MRGVCLAALAAILAPGTALAQVAPTAGAAEPDAARLALARQVIDQIMPPATREAMVQSMLTPMQANIRQGLEQSEGFQRAVRQNPKTKAIFDQFLAKQQTRSREQLSQNLPTLVDAMARAYARRFDIRQLEELKRFFSTPTGQAYMQASASIMADPDIAAWQRKTMSQAMTQMQDDIATMAKDIEATQQDKK